MRRVRIVLALLLLALAVPVTLIVSRALESIDFERRARQQAVTDRVFDEMERTLSEFLTREEARPPDDYAFYSRLEEGDGRTKGVRVRSPLSHPASEPFVLLHFQIDPDGEIDTPLRPRDEAGARAFGDWPPPESSRARVERATLLLERRVKPFWSTAIAAQPTKRTSSDLDAEISSAVQQLKTLDALGESISADDEANAMRGMAAQAEPIPDRKDDLEAKQATGKKKMAGAYYDVIDSLNRAAQDRRSRKERVAEIDPAQQFAKYKLNEAPREGRSASSEKYGYVASKAAAGIIAGRLSASEHEERELGREGGRQPSRPAASSLRALAPESAALPAAAPLLEETVRVILHPMAGAPLDDELLMLYRTVSVDGVGYRQGLLLDRRALGDHLERSVLSARPIADAIQMVFEGENRSPPPANWVVSSHRFVEPFDGLQVRLALAPLAGMASPAPLYALAALLAVVAVGGVMSVHRMVGVVVDFAERRSNLVASVSHELKTPLTSIRMYSEMLRDGLIGDTKKREEYYRTIHDESERLSRLIDNVLEFSRLEKGSRVFNLSAGSLGEAVDEIAARLRAHAEDEGFELRVEIEPDLPPVRFDRDALVQIVFNLVDNAIKYSADSDRCEVVLRCSGTESGGVVVSVRDFGPGVSRRHLSQIFEPFYRAEPELTGAAPGSGIGLALVKELSEAMGACVTGANAEDGGFRVDIAFQAASASG